jgi:hypothetical protein
MVVALDAEISRKLERCACLIRSTLLLAYDDAVVELC